MSDRSDFRPEIDALVRRPNLASDADNEAQVHALLHALPVAVYTTDAAGRITFYNEAAAALWGCRPKLGSDEWCGSWRLFWPDGTALPHDQCPMAIAIKENRAIDGMEAAAERPDGVRVPFLAFPTPLRDASGEIVGAVNGLRGRDQWRDPVCLDESVDGCGVVGLEIGEGCGQSGSAAFRGEPADRGTGHGLPGS